MRRLLAIFVVAAGLSPGLLWRAPPVERGPRPLTITALPMPAAGVRLGPGLVLARGWRLASRDERFGGYSALLPLPGGELLALSDRGYFLRLAAPDRGARSVAMGAADGSGDGDKRQVDIESATRDPLRGTLWLGYEGRNAIRRTTVALGTGQEVRPPDMAGWPANRGPEAFVRLADGRFVVLSEALGGWGPPASEGLLFPGDPVAGARPMAFRFVPPPDFRPTDIAQLPDGRVVILLRRLQLALPPRLTSRLVVADPADIAEGKAWPWRPLAEIAAPLPAENYEGLAIEPRGGGAVRLWLISDDNRAVFQRTLLLALDWRPSPTKKARRTAARPS